MAYELRTYQLQLGYPTVPSFLELYADGLRDKLSADDSGASTLVTLLYSDVGPLNMVVELWRHERLERSPPVDQTRTRNRAHVIAIVHAHAHAHAHTCENQKTLCPGRHGVVLGGPPLIDGALVAGPGGPWAWRAWRGGVPCGVAVQQ